MFQKNNFLIVLAVLAIAGFMYFLNTSTHKDVAMQESNKEEETSEATDLPEDFRVFYQRFHGDTIYQIEHIPFPISGMKKSEEGIFSEPWEKHEWVFQNSPVKFKEFEVVMHDYGTFIEEVIQDRGDRFRMKRRFSKLDTSWALIYYEEMGPIVN